MVCISGAETYHIFELEFSAAVIHLKIGTVRSDEPDPMGTSTSSSMWSFRSR
jgi:hypothetical protein